MAIVREMTFVIRSTVTDLTDEGLPTGEDEVSEVTLTGFGKEKDGVLLFSYAEESEGGKVFSDIAKEGDAVTVSRHGAIESTILFKEGETTTSLYGIPPYSFDMTVTTLRVRDSLSASGGTLDLFYRMTVGGAPKKVHFRFTAARA